MGGDKDRGRGMGGDEDRGRGMVGGWVGMVGMKIGVGGWWGDRGRGMVGMKIGVGG